MLSRFAICLYGVIAYGVFLGSFLYAIGFLGNFGVPKTIDTGRNGAWSTAVVIDLVLLGLFAVQHSVMARPGFKQWWTKLIPQPMERSTYVLFSSLLLIVLFWQWRPFPAEIWHLDHVLGVWLLRILFGLGWVLVLLASFQIDHWSLFGLKQVTAHLQGREHVPPSFKMPLLYRYVRHPIMLGFLIAFWVTPVMTVGHLLFAVATTGYIFLGLWLEERDLIRVHGDPYRDYRRQVPMLIPWRGRALP